MNEPAFPNVDFSVNKINGASGMTLRDYFAAKAMNGILAREPKGLFSNWAKVSYEIADAMLKARGE